MNISLDGSKIIRLDQGSTEWVALRRNYVTATEISTITNRNSWATFEKHKTNPSRFKSKAMERGNALEPVARKALEGYSGIRFFPAVFVNDTERLLASLDGLAIGRRATCEIKCPEKGKDSALWKDALQGKIKKVYRAQIQQGLLLTGAPVCLYWVYDEISDTGIMIEVYPDQGYQVEILDSVRSYISYKVEARNQLHPRLAGIIGNKMKYKSVQQQVA